VGKIISRVHLEGVIRERVPALGHDLALVSQDVSFWRGGLFTRKQEA